MTQKTLLKVLIQSFSHRSVIEHPSRIKAKAKNEKKVRVSRKTKQEIKAAATDAMIDKFAQKTVAQNPMTVLSTAIALFKQTIRLMR